MRLTLKISAAYILWTAAVGCAIGFSFDRDEVVLIWGILTAAAASVASAMVAGDYIAAEAAHYIVDRVKAERQETVDRAVVAIRQTAKAREDRIVSRVQSANEAAFKRVAAEVADAIMRDAPTRLR